MKTYTTGMTPIKVIEECLPHKYKMELNKADMLVVLDALLFFHDELSHGDPEPAERALNLRSSILTTIGIEEI